ncbi:aldehyde dehydrogenase family protein [Vibrio sp.]|uniref:aldehyde dehydrogenase family protein n=1 Tax=Vibrio sp. TaxID=678 RepID=UPI003D1511BF
MQKFEQVFIDGKWCDAQGNPRDVINPADATVIASIRDASVEQTEQAILAARRAFPAWQATTAQQRSELIAKLVEVLQRRQDEMVSTIRDEVGCPEWFSKLVQVEDSVDALSKYADCCQMVEETETIENALVIKEAIGVCSFITPWNYPLYQLVGKVGPALAAGCTMVLKPSEQTPLHALLFAEAMAEAGFPAGVFNLVLGDGPTVGARMTSHPEVDLVSFTGSTRAGVAISQAAAPSIKRVCLELGGKSPLLITEDAELEAAVKFGIDDVMLNSGQTCTALTRMLVPASRYQEATAIAKQYAESLKLADPKQEDAFLGPVSSARQLAQVERYVELGIREGATLLCGGQRERDLGDGYYYQPTIFTDVNNQMSIAREEIFGPVLCMIPYDTIENGIDIANDTNYGLSARVFVANQEQGIALARQIRAGQVYVNDAEFNNFTPFGGYKQSGIGRESGKYGVEEFFEVKSIPLPQ